MANLTQGILVQPVGSGGRRIALPIAANAPLFEGGIVSQIAGACVQGTTANAGDGIGVAEFDALGGATDGAKRIIILTDQIFRFQPGVAAPTDATPFGTPLFMEDDHTVGTGGLGATQKLAGRFVGIEPDGWVRVYMSLAPPEPEASFSHQVVGPALLDQAATTVQRLGRVTRYLLAGVMSQGETVTLGTTGAVVGDIIRIIRTSVSAQTLTVANGGVGGGNLCVLVASKSGFAQALFDGTNWLDDGHSAT